MSRTEQIGQAGPDTFASLAQEDLRMRVVFTKNLGMLLLGIWLILMGLVGYVPLIASLGILINFLAIAAGILILIGR
jgi:hypothetical protein